VHLSVLTFITAYEFVFPTLQSARTAFGPEPTCRDVRSSVAIGGQSGRDAEIEKATLMDPQQT
jgi:hypothetical protein